LLFVADERDDCREDKEKLAADFFLSEPFDRFPNNRESGKQSNEELEVMGELADEDGKKQANHQKDIQ